MVAARAAKAARRDDRAKGHGAHAVRKQAVQQAVRLDRVPLRAIGHATIVSHHAARTTRAERPFQ